MIRASALQVRTGLATLSGEELKSMRERLEEIAASFNIEELSEGEEVERKCICMCMNELSFHLLPACAVLDDDSCQLGEVLELFADVTLPLKVDRLMMVRRLWRVLFSHFKKQLHFLYHRLANPGERKLNLFL